MKVWVRFRVTTRYWVKDRVRESVRVRVRVRIEVMLWFRYKVKGKF